MTKIISFIGQKGGSGKSTIAVHFAMEALLSQEGCQVAIIDMDPQGSVLEWSRMRKDANPVVVSATAKTLEQTLKQAQEEGFDYVVVDTPGRQDTTLIELVSAMSDLILLPLRPSLFDVRAVAGTITLLNAKACKMRFLLSQTPARGNQVADAEAYCARAHSEVAITRSKIGYRTAFQKAMIDGQGVQEVGRDGKKGQLEIAGLFEEILDLLGN
ncbi:chromosome partitioning protein [Sulfitobacter undariae]|uniref:Chromosome partitioning protein n=1 Tax=Sulfitobacter undariae TaxID=1563671 RepID=A0A7W6H1H0_9RHOB|nr:ParA family protein [Sulfitobacter undariae]MBB3995540.1 chromosome partitioning protein [Sulfitobacter undariae]